MWQNKNPVIKLDYINCILSILSIYIYIKTIDCDLNRKCYKAHMDFLEAPPNIFILIIFVILIFIIEVNNVI